MKKDRILNMTIYKHELAVGLQNLIIPDLAKQFCFHAFIVFETDKWFYSAEKYQERVSLQRAKKLRGKTNYFLILILNLCNGTDVLATYH